MAYIICPVPHHVADCKPVRIAVTSACGAHILAGLQGVCLCYCYPHTGSEQLYGEIKWEAKHSLSVMVLRLMESKNCFSWKSPLGSFNPTIT